MKKSKSSTRPGESASRYAPVGVFDSGLGGLTVVKRIAETLPDESVLYVGDTARIPYGPKSPEVIREFSLQIGRYMVARGVKIIVVACNTASAYGLSTLSAELSVPVMGVISPGAATAVGTSVSGRIGVLGTKGTIRSEAYQNAILVLRQDAKVFARSAPLFVPLVEEGHVSLKEPLVQRAAEMYVTPLIKRKIDTLVLGCTHYPLLARAITKFVGPDIKVVDSASTTAAALKESLAQLDLLSDRTPRYEFLSTDDTAGFRDRGARFLGRPVSTVAPLSLEELTAL